MTYYSKCNKFIEEQVDTTKYKLDSNKSFGGKFLVMQHNIPLQWKARAISFKCNYFPWKFRENFTEKLLSNSEKNIGQVSLVFKKGGTLVIKVGR
jgi:hypothetical protein